MPNLIDGFVRSAKAHPARPCLEVDDRIYRYEEAALVASHLSEVIRKVQDESNLVGILARRSATAYLGVVATLLEGHGYVPLNPVLPAERLAGIVERTGLSTIVVGPEALEILPHLARSLRSSVSFILAECSQRPDLGGCSVLCVPELVPATEIREPPASDGSKTAYIIFTSGSTGTPKGVPVAHQNAIAFLEAMQEATPLLPEDRCIEMFEMSFDASVHSIFQPWWAGACLCSLPADQLLNPSEFVSKREITSWASVPSVASAMQYMGILGPNRFPALRQSTFGGEALQAELAAAWREAAPNSRLFNIYGPTECSVVISAYEWRPETSASECADGIAPIGQIIGKTEVCLLDRDGRYTPDASEGELCATGPQVVAGYLDDPERTAQSFVQIPELGSRIWYRTGDWVKRGPRDQWLFASRVDEQVKVSGYRIELQEIEQVIRRVPGLHEVAVVGWPLRQGRADELIAFVSSEAPIDPAEIRRICAEPLPSYMIPRRIVMMKALPHTTAGKIDKVRLLSELDAGVHQPQSLGAEDAYEAPANDLERRVCEVWQDVLRVRRVGRHNDFFELGGDSLRVTQVIGALGHEDSCLARAVPGDVYTHRTVARLVRALEGRDDSTQEHSELLPGLFREDERTLFRQYAGTSIEEASFPLTVGGRLVDDIFPVTGAQHHDATFSDYSTVLIGHWFSTRLDEGLLQKAIEIACSRFPIVRTGFVGSAEGAMLQVVHSEVSVSLDVSAPGGSVEDEIRRFWERPFQMDRPPLVRMGLWQTNEEKSGFYCAYHHSVEDFFTAVAFEKTIFETYVALARGLEPDEESYPTFSRYVAVERSPRSETEGRQVRRHFRDMFAGFDWMAQEGVFRGFAATGFDPAVENARRHATLVLDRPSGGGFSFAVYAHAAWAIVLSMLLETRDVAFISALSDRYLGSEALWTLPGPMYRGFGVRVDFGAYKSVSDLLMMLREHLIVTSRSPIEAEAVTGELVQEACGGESPWYAMLSCNELPDRDEYALPAELGHLRSDIRAISMCPLACITSLRDAQGDLTFTVDAGRVEWGDLEDLGRAFNGVMRSLPERLNDSLDDVRARCVEAARS